jgi:hypothetical protein
MRAGRYYGIEDIRIEEIEGIEDAVMREHHVKTKPAFVPYLACGTREDFLALDLPEHPTLHQGVSEFVTQYWFSMYYSSRNI